MNKVEIVIAGKRALVDADMVKLHEKKNALCKKAADHLFDESPSADAIRREIAGKIIALNRRIRKNVIFI